MYDQTHHRCKLAKAHFDETAASIANILFPSNAWVLPCKILACRKQQSCCFDKVGIQDRTRIEIRRILSIDEYCVFLLWATILQRRERETRTNVPTRQTWYLKNDRLNLSTRVTEIPPILVLVNGSTATTQAVSWGWKVTTTLQPRRVLGE